MSEKLKPCPCGKVPRDIHIADNGQRERWAGVMGSCCASWEIEFQTFKLPLDSEECKKYAIRAWNDAPRAESQRIIY